MNIFKHSKTQKEIKGLELIHEPILLILHSSRVPLVL